MNVTTINPDAPRQGAGTPDPQKRKPLHQIPVLNISEQALAQQVTASLLDPDTPSLLTSPLFLHVFTQTFVSLATALQMDNAPAAQDALFSLLQQTQNECNAVSAKRVTEVESLGAQVNISA